MSAVVHGRRTIVMDELRKLPAFFRRDLLVTWSYRVSFFADWANLITQVMIFFFVNKLVDPAKLPSFGGERATYMQFVVVGIAVTSFMQISLGSVVTAFRTEQLQGTLEMVLVSPTSPATFQVGSVLYDLAYVPIRVLLFVGVAILGFDTPLASSGVLPAIAVLVVFVLFVWGLGIASAAGILTFRRGTGIVGFLASLLTIGSGTYFPVGLFPDWIRPLAALNPITIALDAIRGALLGQQGWAVAIPAIVKLVPVGVVSLTLGVLSFRWALKRERRRGTLGLY